MGRKTAIIAAAVIAALAAVLAFGQPRPSGPPSLPAEPASSDPLELFTVMMPVFTHDRCANCHGGVDPHDEASNTHAGGFRTVDETCADSGCHTQTDDSNPETKWKTASTFHSFGGRTAKELCKMQSDVADDLNSRRPDGYFHHLDTDFLIDLAFIGLSGGASDTAASPRMGKDAFLRAARAWLYLGAKCKPWTGSITQHETFASSYSFPLGGEGSAARVTVNEQAQRILTVDRVDGVATYRINQGGHQNMLTVTQFDAPPCEATITSDTRWNGQNQAPERGNVNIRIRPDGSYTIRLQGPKEKTVTLDSGHLSTNCPFPIPMSSADTTVLDLDPWKTTIHCPATFQQDPASGNTIDCDLYDPKTNPRLKGTMTRTLRSHEDAADPASWLEASPVVGISRSDTGAQIPVTVVTTWDLTLPP